MQKTVAYLLREVLGTVVVTVGDRFLCLQPAYWVVLDKRPLYAFVVVFDAYIYIHTHQSERKQSETGLMDRRVNKKKLLHTSICSSSKSLCENNQQMSIKSARAVEQPLLSSMSR